MSKEQEAIRQAAAAGIGVTLGAGIGATVGVSTAAVVPVIGWAVGGAIIAGAGVWGGYKFLTTKGNKF